MKLSRREERKAQATAAEEGSETFWNGKNGMERKETEYNSGGKPSLYSSF
jgi:hypothetical protein